MLTHGDQMLRDTARTAFWGSFNNYPDFLDRIAMRKPSTADQEIYAGFGYAPGVREMVGGRKKRSVPQYTYTVVNKQWENTVTIDYITRKSPRGAAAVAELLTGMGRKARAFPTKNASVMINSNPTGYDNVAFFSTAHVEPGAAYQTNQSNALTRDVVAPDLANGGPTDLEMAAAIRTLRLSLFGYVDGDGDPYWPGEDPEVLIMVPTHYMEVTNRVMTADDLTGPVSNDLKGRFKMLVNPYLTAPTASHGYFYAINLSSPDRPILNQVFEDVSMSDDMGGDNEFNNRDASFGSFAVYEQRPAQWRSIARMDLT